MGETAAARPATMTDKPVTVHISPGTPSVAGEIVCRRCGATGRRLGAECRHCAGRGTMAEVLIPLDRFDTYRQLLP